MPGYSFVEKHRQNKVGGGVGISIKEHASFLERGDLSYFHDDIESIFIEIPKDNFNLGKLPFGELYKDPKEELCNNPASKDSWAPRWA